MAMFKPKAGSWSCDVCMITNPADKVKCAACETPKPGAAPAAAATNGSSSSFGGGGGLGAAGAGLY